MSDLESYLTLDDIHASYRRRPVLTGASWQVGSGVTALLGPNGAGKTTLMRTVLGLHRLDRGEIRVMGHAVRRRDSLDAIHRLVGYAPQGADLPALARVADVVAYAGWLSGMSRIDAHASAISTLGALDLDRHARRRIRTLSGGERQRVVLANALVHQPVLLLLDEPSAGLDPANRVLMREVIRDLASSRAVVLSTHLVEDVQHLAGDVAVLADGHICFSGATEELGALSAPGHEDTRPGTPFERGYLQLLGAAERATS